MRVLAALALFAAVGAPERVVRPRAVPGDPERVVLHGAAVRGEPERVAPHRGADSTPVVPASVRLDVAATDARGRHVENLQAADFELTVDGTPQPLDAVKSVRIDPASGAEDNARPFAIFLDEYHTSPAGADRIRAELMRFVDSQLGPNDPLAVMKPLDSLFAIPVERDRAAVREAVRSFEGRKGDYTPRNAFESSFMGRSPATIDRLRRQVTISALNALAVRLGSVSQGRKAVLFVSEGFQPSTPVRGEELLPTVQSLERTANRHNVAIYPINTAADTPDAAVLQTIAANTDGEVTAADGDLDKALRRIVADSSSYYLLTYRPTVAADGRFHPVQVRVRRAGVQVRSRKGFWAVAAEDPLRDTRTKEAAAREALVNMAPRHLSPLIRPWFGMARGDGGRTAVTFVWEPNRRVPGDRPRLGTPSQIAIKATTADGLTAYEGVVQPTGAAAGNRDAAMKAVFEVPPGRVQLHMSITADNARELDFDSRDLTVRDLRQPVAIATPAILRARNVRELRALASDPDAAPVASREFSRAERLLVRFAAYAPAGDPPTVAARLVSRAGKTMRTFEAVAVAGSPDVKQIDVSLAAFAPGEYLIEVTVSAHAGTAKELVNFRVTG